MHRKISLLVLALLPLFGACSVESSDTPKPKIEGRDETKGIRNTREVGYSGDAIADKVDAALDANDKHNQQLQESDPSQ